MLHKDDGRITSIVMKNDYAVIDNSTVILGLIVGTVIGAIYFLILSAIIDGFVSAMPVGTSSLNQTMQQLASDTIESYLFLGSISEACGLATFFAPLLYAEKK
jgi:hypothetical protein